MQSHGTGGYDAFVARKAQLEGGDGFEPVWMPDFLFPFQRALVDWAVRGGRLGIGVELKPSYYRQAVKNLDQATVEVEQDALFPVGAGA